MPETLAQHAAGARHMDAEEVQASIRQGSRQIFQAEIFQPFVPSHAGNCANRILQELRQIRVLDLGRISTPAMILDFAAIWRGRRRDMRKKACYFRKYHAKQTKPRSCPMGP